MDWDTVAWAKSTYPQSPSAEEQEERQYDRNRDEEFHRLTSTPPETVTMVAERSSTIVGLRFASQDDRKGETDGSCCVTVAHELPPKIGQGARRRQTQACSLHR